MKKIITWIITILGFLWFILSIIFLVNIPMLHKEVKENFPVMGSIKAGNSVIKWTNYVSVGE